MKTKGFFKRNIGLILFFAIAAFYPVILSSSYYKQLGVVVLLYAFYASSWNILGGYAGQLSLGHGAYIGVGAYITTVLFSEFNVSPWLGMLISGVIVGMFAVLIGYPCFRLSGVYYSLSTVALVNVMRLFFIAEDTIFGFETGSSLGYKLPWYGESLVNMEFLDKKYYLSIRLPRPDTSAAITSTLTVMRAIFCSLPSGSSSSESDHSTDNTASCLTNASIPLTSTSRSDWPR